MAQSPGITTEPGLFLPHCFSRVFGRKTGSREKRDAFHVLRCALFQRAKFPRKDVFELIFRGHSAKHVRDSQIHLAQIDHNRAAAGGIPKKAATAVRPCGGKPIRCADNLAHPAGGKIKRHDLSRGFCGRGGDEGGQRALGQIQTVILAALFQVDIIGVVAIKFIRKGL